LPCCVQYNYVTIVSMTLQHYHEDGSTTMIVDSPLFDKPMTIKHDEFENWVIDSIVRDAEREGLTYKPLPPHEFAQVFPQCKTIYTKEVKEIKAKLLALQDEYNKVNGQKISREITVDEGDFVLEGIEDSKKYWLDKKKDLETVLNFTGAGKKNRKAAQDFAVAIQKAKAYPIENLMKIQQNKGECLWHEDRDPSLHYYRKDNKVHCFVCNKQWDSIDVVMKQHDCDLKEAVGIINNGI